MDRQFWLGRWAEGRIGFHQKMVNPRLLAYADRLAAPGGRVFVPLAGKSNDMAWLARRGDAVVGVELARAAVESFYEEHELRPSVSTEGKLDRFEAGGVTLFAGDFFDLLPAHVGDVSWVFDRAAYFALPEAMRERYAAHMASLLPAGARILLLTLRYDQSKVAGPPFSIPEGELDRVFGGAFSLEMLLREKVPVGNPRLEANGVTEMEESVWLLRKDCSG